MGPHAAPVHGAGRCAAARRSFLPSWKAAGSLECVQPLPTALRRREAGSGPRRCTPGMRGLWCAQCAERPEWGVGVPCPCVREVLTLRARLGEWRCSRRLQDVREAQQDVVGVMRPARLLLVCLCVPCLGGTHVAGGLRGGGLVSERNLAPCWVRLSLTQSMQHGAPLPSQVRSVGAPPYNSSQGAACACCAVCKPHTTRASAPYSPSRFPTPFGPTLNPSPANMHENTTHEDAGRRAPDCCRLLQLHESLLHAVLSFTDPCSARLAAMSSCRALAEAGFATLQTLPVAGLTSRKEDAAALLALVKRGGSAVTAMVTLPPSGRCVRRGCLRRTLRCRRCRHFVTVSNADDAGQEEFWGCCKAPRLT